MTDSFEKSINEIIEGCGMPLDRAIQPDLIDEGLALIKLHSLLREEHKFSVGGLVEWKPGLANKNQAYKKPLIVVEVLKEPGLNEEERPDSPYYREVLDIVCASLNGGKFYEFRYDSRRLQPYQPH